MNLKSLRFFSVTTICFLLVCSFLITADSNAYASSFVFQENINDGKKLLQHTVEQGETIFSICRKYNIDQKTLIAENPQLTNGLRTGDLLNIPVITEGKKDATVSDIQFILHTVKKQETVYSIAKQYNVNAQKIIEFNPDTESGIVENQTIRIPKKTDTTPPADDILYFLYTIDSGDTFFALSRRFNVPVDKLTSLNPLYTSGLPVGVQIQVPFRDSDGNQNTAKLKEKDKHEIKKGETLYSISQLTGFDIAQLEEFNPFIKNRPLVVGETLTLPRSKELSVKTTSAVIDENKTSESMEEPKNWVKKTSNDTFRIVLFLPFMLAKNEKYNQELLSDEQTNTIDTLNKSIPGSPSNNILALNDSIAYADSTANAIYRTKQLKSVLPISKTTLNFYTGFLLAVDSLEKEGLKIRLDVFDTEMDATTIRGILRRQELLASNLIVGPRDIKLQNIVSEYSAKNQIPMIAPINSDDSLIYKNPFFFQPTPSKNFYLQKTAEYLAVDKTDKKFIVLAFGDYQKHSEAYVTNHLQKNISPFDFSVVNFNGTGITPQLNIRKELSTDKENVIFIPTTDSRREREANIARAMNALQALSSEFIITLVGMSDYTRMGSINTEYFHRLNFRYLSAAHVDYSNLNVIEFVKKYRDTFHLEPDQYSFRGYDIAFYFGKAYQKFGANYSEKLSGFDANLLQDDFKFQRIAKLCGYMNHSLYTINYTSDWEVNASK